MSLRALSLLLPALVVASALSGPVRADDLDDAKTKAAQLVVLAKLAGVACPGLGTNDTAVTAFMAHAQLSEQGLGARFQGATQEAISSFKASSDQNRDLACAQLFKRLGEDGLGLVVETDEDPQ